MIFSEVTKPLSFHSPLRGLTSLPASSSGSQDTGRVFTSTQGTCPPPTQRRAPTLDRLLQCPATSCHPAGGPGQARQVSDHSLGWEPAAAGEQGIRLSSFKVPLSGLPVELAGKLSSPQFCSTPFLFPRGSHSSPTLQTQFVKKVHIGSQSNTPRGLSTSSGNFRY